MVQEIKPPEVSNNLHLNGEEQKSVAQGALDGSVATLLTLLLTNFFPELNVSEVAGIVGCLVFIIKLARKFFFKAGHLLN